MNPIETFRNDGVVHLAQVLDANALQLARDAYEWSLANPGRGATRLVPGTPGSFYGDLANPLCFEAYKAVNTHTVMSLSFTQPCCMAALQQRWAKPVVPCLCATLVKMRQLPGGPVIPWKGLRKSDQVRKYIP